MAPAVLKSLEQNCQHFPWTLLYFLAVPAGIGKSQTQSMDIIVYRVVLSRCFTTWEGCSKKRRSSPRSYLSPNADSVSDVIFTVRELSDAIVHSNTAFSRSKIFFCHFYPAQRSHSKALKRNQKTSEHVSEHTTHCCIQLWKSCNETETSQLRSLARRGTKSRPCRWAYAQR